MLKLPDTVFLHLVGLILLPLIFTALPAQAADIAKIGAEIDSPIKAVNLAKDGPEITLLMPKAGGTYISPIGIEITFEPEQGTTVDLETLQVTVVSSTSLGVFEVDITEDIAKYASQEGINAPKAEIPAGDHLVTVQVADSEKRMTKRQLAITVREESVLERRARN